MLSELLLLSGNDIPFPAAAVNIHQPTLKEIAYIGEEAFFVGCELLIFSKDNLTSEDKARLNNQSNFDIIMSIMKDKTNEQARMSSINAQMVLTLLFPDYQLLFLENCIELKKDDFLTHLDNSNFIDFQQIIKEILCLKEKEQDGSKPQGRLAQKIADKLKKGRQKIASLRKDTERVAIFSRYLSILAVGEKKDLNELFQYTVYQLSDEFQRFELKLQYDIYLRAKMAGAKDLKEVEEWMGDIHSKTSKEKEK